MSESEEGITWAIRITRRASADIQEAWEHFAATADEAIADVWQESLEQAISGLAEFPKQHPVAPESYLFGMPPVHRQLHRRTRTGPAHHILFRIYGPIEAPSDAPFVRIIAVRHAAMAVMTEDEAQLITAAEK
jgi:plasmid stabilization system protein ParE